MTNEKLICNQICTWNDPSDGCVRPNGRICPMSSAKVDANGWAQVKMASEKRLIYADSGQESVEYLKKHLIVGDSDFLKGYLKGAEALADGLAKLTPVDAVMLSDLEAWLYEIAMNNSGEKFDGDFSDAVEEIINRLDGLRVFAEERRTDG